MKKITLIILCLFPIYGIAQKSAPVAGDVITLLDLLAKDYTITPENLNEAVAADRAKVLAIFKAYVPDISSSELFAAVQTGMKELKKQEEALKSIAAAGVSVDNNYQVDKAVQQYKDAYDFLESAKTSYYKARYQYDSNQFSGLLLKLEGNNPYLSKIILAFIDKYAAVNQGAYDQFSKRSSSVSVNKGFPIAGGLGLELVIDELAKFIAEGIKKELTLFAVEKIREYLNHPKPDNYAYELLAVMPETTAYLKSFTADQLVNINDQLKQHIENDLNKILNNMASLRHTPKIAALIQQYPDLGFAFEGLELLPKLQEIKNPVDYFGIMENSRLLSAWSHSSNGTKYNLAQGIRLISMVAYSLTVTENNEQRFVSIDALTAYASDINFYLLYVGLLNQQNIHFYKIKFRNRAGVEMPVNIGRIMGTVTTSDTAKLERKKEILREALVPVLENAEKIYNLSQTLKQHNENSNKSEQVYAFVDAFIKIIEELGTSVELIAHEGFFGLENTNLAIRSKIKPYIETSRSGNAIVLDLQQKKYSAALTKALRLPLLLKGDNDGNNPFLKIESRFQELDVILNLNDAFNFNVTSSDSEVMAAIAASREELILLDERIPNSGYTNAKNSLQAMKNLSAAMSVTFNKKTATDNIRSLKTALSGQKLNLADMPGMQQLFAADINHMKMPEVRKLLNTSLSYLLSFQIYIPPTEIQLHQVINSFRDYVLALPESINLLAVQQYVATLKNSFSQSTLQLDLIKTTLASGILSMDFSSDDQPIILAMQNTAGELQNFGTTLTDPDFTQLKIAITTFQTNVNSLSVPLDRNRLQNYLNMLRVSVGQHKYKLIAHFRILEPVTSSITYQELKGKDSYSSVMALLDKELQKYAEAYFDYYVFNEPLQVDMETELHKKLQLLLPQLVQNSQINDNVTLRLLGFFNDMALSKNSQDVKSAIENFAEPTGTSSLKEHSGFNISLNTYPGLLAGWEYSDSMSVANFVGITAPIGLYTQFFPIKGWGSLGLFIPIIDIGAPVRIRLDSDRDTESLPEFEFADIFSPGLYISYGFPKSPFAINIGFQYGPKLRNIPEPTTQDSPTSFTSVESYRFGVGFVIDIPLLTLSNKPRF